MKTTLLASLIGIAVLCSTATGQSLTGFASFPADTFAPGPTSGQLITPANGRTPPFVGKQPIQGISSVLKTSGGDFLIMCDNGFGAKENSVDFVLRVYRIDADFRSKSHGDGQIEVESFFTLRDPNHKINFPIVADLQFYPASTIAVDPAIRHDRLLTGGDFDIEAFRQAPDGTYWFGDEFGPFLIHTDSKGRVLETPYPLPGVRSPQNPFLAGGIPNLPRSKGFEGMAISPNGKRLYPMLEGPLTTDLDQRRLIINEFDIPTRRYSGRQWFYRLDVSTATGQSIGDLTTVNKDTFLVIERDNFEGAAAQFKKIFLVDFTKVDSDGFLVKREVADLLQIDDPGNLSGLGAGTFRFPFQTIESVIPLNDTTIGVLNDNNYPFSNGRIPGQSDPNEFIILKLDHPLPLDDDDRSHGHEKGRDH